MRVGKRKGCHPVAMGGHFATGEVGSHERTVQSVPSLRPRRQALAPRVPPTGERGRGRPRAALFQHGAAGGGSLRRLPGFRRRAFWFRSNSALAAAFSLLPPPSPSCRRRRRRRRRRDARPRVAGSESRAPCTLARGGAEDSTPTLPRRAPSAFLWSSGPGAPS